MLKKYLFFLLKYTRNSGIFSIKDGRIFSNDCISFIVCNISQGVGRILVWIVCLKGIMILRMFLMIYANRLGLICLFRNQFIFSLRWNLAPLDSNLIVSVVLDGSLCESENLDGTMVDNISIGGLQYDNNLMFSLYSFFRKVEYLFEHRKLEGAILKVV